jgi:hypothetical protein
LEVVVNASPTLFFAWSGRSPLLLELASVEEVLVNGSPSLFVCAEPSAVRGASLLNTRRCFWNWLRPPQNLCRGKQKSPDRVAVRATKNPPGVAWGVGFRC